MTDLWTPSDNLLEQDPIAKAKIENPFDPPGLHAPAGDEDDDANAEAAAAALAESRGDKPADGFDGAVDDDDAVDEPGETDDVPSDV